MNLIDGISHGSNNPPVPFSTFSQKEDMVSQAQNENIMLEQIE
jgi:hypothetical protein